MSGPATSVDREKRTATVQFSTGADVYRNGPQPDGSWEPWVERLRIEGCDMSRLNARAAPVLIDHATSSTALIGTVESAKREGSALTASIRFGNGALANEYFEDVADGIRRSVSVGYQIVQWRKLGEENKRRVWLAENWIPVELSFVAVGADPAAGVRQSDTTGVAQTTFLTRSLPMEENTTQTGAAGDTQTRGAGVPDAGAVNTREQERIESIEWLARKLNLSNDAIFYRALDGMPVETARTALINRAAELSQATLPRGGGAIGFGGNANGVREAFESAIANRLNPAVTVTREGERFAGMPLLEIDREWGRMTGQRQAMTRSGMMTTSDFPIILSGAAQLALAQAYATTPPALEAISRKITTADKLPFNVLRVTSSPELLELGEHAEIKSAPLDEASESIRVATFARMLSFSRDLILADRLGALQDFTLMGARAAQRKKGDLLTSALISNPLMNDGVPLFHAQRGNLAGTGTVLSMTSLEQAVIAIRSQKAEDGSYAGIVPAFLVVGPKNEVKARQLVASIQAGEAANVNPYAGLLTVVVEERFEDFRWYVAASLQTACLGFAVLDGSRRMSTADGVPKIDFVEGWRTLGLEARIICDFGAAPLDPKAIYYNPGAAS